MPEKLPEAFEGLRGTVVTLYKNDVPETGVKVGSAEYSFPVPRKRRK